MALRQIKNIPYPSVKTVEDVEKYLRDLRRAIIEDEYAQPEELQNVIYTIDLDDLANTELADPGADRIVFWDDGAGYYTWLTANTGLAISTTNLNLSHLGLEALTDPGADRIFFWDDGESASKWLAPDGTSLEISTTTLQVRADGINDTHIDWGAGANQVNAADVPVGILGTPTYDNVQDYINQTSNRGVISGLTLVGDDVNGNVNVTAGTAICHITDDDNSAFVFFDFAGVTDVALDADVTTYFYLDYNGGTPQVVTDITGALFYTYDHIILGCCYRHGTHVHCLNSEASAVGIGHKLKMHFFEDSKYHRTSGLVTTGTGTRNLDVTQGIIWAGLTRMVSLSYDTSATDTGTADDTEAYKLHDADGGFTANDVGKVLENTTDATYTYVSAYVDSGELTLDDDIFVSGETYELYDAFDYWYNTDGGSTWAHTQYSRAISNTQYNRQDSPYGLASLTSNRFGVHWVYSDAEGENIFVVYGQGNYTASQAEEAAVPATLPPIAAGFGILLAKIVCQEGTDTMTITYPWTSAFVSSLATDHGSLGGLGDDDHTQYVKDSEYTQDGGILVGTGAGTFQEETQSTLLDSLGLGTSDSPTFNDLSLNAPSNIYALSHDSFADFAANEHFTEASIDHGSIAGLDDGDHDAVYYTETEINTWRSNVTQAEMSYLDGVTSDIQTQLDARCLESVFGTSISNGLVLDVTNLEVDHDAANNFVAAEHIDWTGCADNLVTTGDVTCKDLYIEDNANDHHLRIYLNENLSGDHALQLIVNDSDISLNLYENFTIGNGQAGTLTFSVASKVLTVAESCTLDQDLQQSASPTFNDITAGHIGLGSAASPNVDYYLYAREVLTDTDNSPKLGLYAYLEVAKTAAAMTSWAGALRGRAVLNSTNTQNWSDSEGLRGVYGQISTEGGSSGTITGMVCFAAQANVADAATVTNLYGLKIDTPAVAGAKVTNEYGIYVANQNTGATLNYAIYTGTGLVHLGDAVDISGTLKATNTTTLQAANTGSALKLQETGTNEDRMAINIATDGSTPTGGYFTMYDYDNESWNAGIIQKGGYVGIGKTPGSRLDLNLSTEDLEIVDAGSAGATEQDWIEVECNGVQGYIRVYASK